MKIEEALTKLIPTQSGTYNKFCPRCFCRDGHNLVWCRECGYKMIVYDLRPITNIEWIARAFTESSAFDRFCLVCTIENVSSYSNIYKERDAKIKSGEFGKHASSWWKWQVNRQKELYKKSMAG